MTIRLGMASALMLFLGLPMAQADHRKAAEEGGGFKGQTLVARDLASLRLPAK